MTSLAILGTRGIPNHYGGFERFAEVISLLLRDRGIRVTVLYPGNRADTPFTFSDNVFVTPIHIPKFLPNNAQTLYYDLLSLIWLNRNRSHVALECGHSFSPWLILFGKNVRSRIITSMDGLEHSRGKWSWYAKVYLRLSERLAVRCSKRVVADSPVIAGYLSAKYRITPVTIPYGAFTPEREPDDSPLKNHSLEKGKYYLVVSRATRENSIEVILEAFAKRKQIIGVVGNLNNPFGQEMLKKYSPHPNIIFLGGIYDQEVLSSLRYHSKGYIHGHTAGGTNPSLLEAMACSCYTIAHDNPFNRQVLNNRGSFFCTTEDLTGLIDMLEISLIPDFDQVKIANRERVSTDYCWRDVADRYYDLVIEVSKAQRMYLHASAKTNINIAHLSL